MLLEGSLSYLKAMVVIATRPNREKSDGYMDFSKTVV